MGLLSKLFGKKDECNALVARGTSIATPSPDTLPIHPDISDLLWIADGAHKNYMKSSNQNVYEFSGIRMTISFSSQEEPSLIYMKQPIISVTDISRVERPPYYPTYSGLTQEQKGVYWKLLANPYDANIDIGFVFILYYGLGRVPTI